MVDFPLSVPLTEFAEELRYTIDIPVARDTMAEGAEEVSFLVTELPLGLSLGTGAGQADYTIDPEIQLDLEVSQERVFEGEAANIILTLSQPLDFNFTRSEYQQEITTYSAEQFAEIFEDISTDPAVRVHSLAETTGFFDLGSEDLDKGFTPEVNLGFGSEGFNFYGRDVQSGYIGVDGLLALSTKADLEDRPQRIDLYDLFDTNEDISTDSARVYNDPLIAPFWDDISLAHLITPGEPVVKTGEIYSITRGEESDQRFIVQWNNVYFDGEYDPDDSSTEARALSFQLVLYERTGDIEFRYLDINGSATEARIGLNDGILGDRAIQLGAQSGITDNTVVRFSRDRNLRINTDREDDLEDTFPLEFSLTNFELDGGRRAEITVGILDDGISEPEELVELLLELPSGLPLTFGDNNGRDTFIIEARQQIEVDIAVSPRRVFEGQTATVELTLSLPLPQDVSSGEIIIDTDEQSRADLGTAFPISIPLVDLIGTLVHTIHIPVLADGITEPVELVNLRVTLPEVTLDDHELRLGTSDGRATFVIDAPDSVVNVDIAVPPGRGRPGDPATLELTLSEPTDYVWRVFSDDSNFLDLRVPVPANSITASITELIDTDCILRRQA